MHTTINISPSFWRNLINNQLAGLWLFLGSRLCFGRVAPTLGQLLVWLVLASSANGLFSWLVADGQGHFNEQGLIAYLLWPSIALICGIFISQRPGHSRLMLVPAILWLVIDTDMALLQCALQFMGQRDWLPDWSYDILPQLFMLLFVWQSLAVVWVFSRLLQWPWWERGLILAATLFTLVVWQVSSKKQPIWKVDEVPATLSEAALYAQSDLLNQALTGLQARPVDQSGWFFLGVAGAGYQDVFRNEVMHIRQIFDRKFGTATHSVVLINNENTLTQQPMATRTSVQRSLDAIGKLMDKDRDVLFLYLTSHGLPGQFELSEEPVSLDDIDPQWLRGALDRAGIRWRVIVISSCYSGSFISALQSPDTLVITASRADRASFGCSNEADYTYFGRAFFDESLQQGNSLQQSFVQAHQLVSKWEAAQGFESSEPQWVLGSALAARLPEFEKKLISSPSAGKSSDSLHATLQSQP